MSCDNTNTLLHTTCLNERIVDEFGFQVCEKCRDSIIKYNKFKHLQFLCDNMLRVVA